MEEGDIPPARELKTLRNHILHEIYSSPDIVMGAGDIVAGIVTGYGLDDQGVGVRVPAG
jgi:hypothetical protein